MGLLVGREGKGGWREIEKKKKTNSPNWAAFGSVLARL